MESTKLIKRKEKIDLCNNVSTGVSHVFACRQSHAYRILRHSWHQKNVAYLLDLGLVPTYFEGGKFKFEIVKCMLYFLADRGKK